MIKILIFISLFFLNLYGENILKGKWLSEKYKQNNTKLPYSVLNLSIEIDKNNYVNGYFTYVTKWGGKVENNVNFESYLKNNSFSFLYDSNWGGTKGKVSIKINNDCTIEWNLIDKPNGMYYAPQKTSLAINRIVINDNSVCNLTNSLKSIFLNKQPLYSNPSTKTKMYLIKGDKVEILEEKEDWLYILYHGKKDIKAWIPKSAVE